MKNTKRILALSLTLLMTVSVLFAAVSCGETAEDPNETGKDNGTSAGTVAETETESPYSQLEKEKFGREFTVLIRHDCEEDFVAEEMTGDLLSDSIYERNTVVAEDYGVEFVFHDKGDDYTAINEALKQQVSGGLDDYDLYIGHKYSFNNLAMNNYLYDMGKITSMDLTNPWWDQACYENLTVSGKTYIMTGDINPCSSMRISSCMVFNKNLMTELGQDVDALNELTENGKWTLDALHDYSKDITFDLNGDSKIDYKDDRFCVTGWMMAAPYALYYGSDANFVTAVDGTPELSYSDDKVTSVYEKIFRVMVEDNAYYVTDLSQYDTMFDVFSEGRALFSVLTLKLIPQYFSDMKDSYGILPIPKYDEYQKEYTSFVNGSTGLVMLAKTEADPEFVGTVMEAMAVYNYEHVTPNMFQVITKLQIAQDPASARMVDLIIRNRVFDLGYYADLDVTNLVKNQLGAKRPEIASQLKSSRKSTERNLEKILQNVDKFD